MDNNEERDERLADMEQQAAYANKQFTMYAFPARVRMFVENEDQVVDVPGMSKRELFAAMAMQGLCSSNDEAGNLITHGHEWIASESVKCADALIAELSKEEPK